MGQKGLKSHKIFMFYFTFSKIKIIIIIIKIIIIHPIQNCINIAQKTKTWAVSTSFFLYVPISFELISKCHHHLTQMPLSINLEG
jgi:hypothetical protein